MQKCSYCGTDLPENARFCGKCGSVQDVISTNAAATSRNTPPPQSWAPEGSTIPATWPPASTYPALGSTPAWPPNGQVQETPPPPPAAENEDERRRGIAPWSPLYGAALGGDALLGSGQAYAPGAPVVPGTPQLGSAPSVTGSPSYYTNAPVAHPTTGAGNAAPVSHPAQGLTHAPANHLAQGSAHASIGHPAQGPTHAPVGHPMQGPANWPVSHPAWGPQPTHHLPEQPRTQEYYPSHEPHRHHDHTAQHNLYRAARVSKVAGGASVKTIMIVVAAVVVVAAGGVGAAHFLLRPQPLISISSSYKLGNAPAGANGTILHISGQHFASNSVITFLLDGQVAPGNSGAQSDSNGNVSTDITITNAWSVGTHTLTAKDASNDSPKNSVSVTIVQPGQAHTPGPNGAPPDDASFKVIAQIQVQNAAGNAYSGQETEVVTGHPDPMGGTVCHPEDNGQPSVTTSVTYNNHVPYRETATYSCSGSYKGGKLTLTETSKSDVVVLSELDGTTTTCTLNSPQPDEQLSGSYTGNNTFSGTITYPAIPTSDYSCNSSYTFFHAYWQGHWTGQVTDLHS